MFEAADENGRQFEFGVSGLLFNNNLILYDRRDHRTLYPQMYFTAVEGPRKRETLTLLPVVETKWRTWKRLYPDTQVIQKGTYSLGQYSRYPYGDYLTDDAFLIFRLNPSLGSNPNAYSTQFGLKDRMLGLRLDGEARAYLFEDMGSEAVINDEIGGVNIVVVWDEHSLLAIPFAREVNGESLTFEMASETGLFPFAFRDVETGTLWNISGESVEGPLVGARLTQVPAHNSFWFAWVTFWPETDVWQP